MACCKTQVMPNYWRDLFEKLLYRINLLSMGSEKKEPSDITNLFSSMFQCVNNARDNALFKS